MTLQERDNIDFQSLRPQERKLLLSALDIGMKNIQCFYCGNKTNYKICGIMPPLKKGEKGRITCDNPCCILEYLEDLERKKEDK